MTSNATDEKPAAPSWVKVASSSEVPVGGRRLYRRGARRIALFRPEEDAVFAVDDRCPHEGYPLVKGELCDRVLTCSWHNYKFELDTGACVKGDEAVRVYPGRIRDGDIEIDLIDPPLEKTLSRLETTLESGLFHGRLGQVTRAVARLLVAGAEPERIAAAAARFDAERAEFGTTHVLPVATDALALADHYPGSEAVLPLIQPFELAAQNHVRRERRPTAVPIDPGPEPAPAGRRFRDAVEAERVQEAEGLVRGALGRGYGRADLEPWFVGVCCDHFLAFGHGLIYTIKAFDLLERVGWERAGDILPGLGVGLVGQTREDVLPEWGWFRRRRDDLAPRLEALYARAGTGPAEPARTDVARAVTFGTRTEAFDAVVRALEAGAPLAAIADGVARAAAERVLRFDFAIDADITLQDGALDVTHTLTFANAVRHAVSRYQDPEVLHLLLQAARFANHAKVLDGEPPAPTHADAGDAEALARELDVRIRARDPDGAIALAAAYQEAGGELEPLEAASRALILEDRTTSPIVVAHVIKTCAAAFDEARRADPETGRAAVRAFVRLAAAPLRERFTARLAHEALRFVLHDKVPRSLT